jgi:hypothetical protein
MDALDVVYLQYMQQGACEVSFLKHLNVLKDFYGEPEWIGEGAEKKLIPSHLDKYRLESEQPLFKVGMMANSAAAINSGLGTVITTRKWGS